MTKIDSLLAQFKTFNPGDVDKYKDFLVYNLAPTFSESGMMEHVSRYPRLMAVLIIRFQTLKNQFDFRYQENRNQIDALLFRLEEYQDGAN